MAYNPIISSCGVDSAPPQVSPNYPELSLIDKPNCPAFLNKTKTTSPTSVSTPADSHPHDPTFDATTDSTTTIITI